MPIFRVSGIGYYRVIGVGRAGGIIVIRRALLSSTIGLPQLWVCAGGRHDGDKNKHCFSEKFGRTAQISDVILFSTGSPASSTAIFFFNHIFITGRVCSCL